MPSFKVITYGCKVNSYESEAFREEFLTKGLFEADSAESADYCIVNTCAVTATGERKCLQMTRRIARTNPGCKIGIVGCSAQISSEKYRRIPGVVCLFGNAAKSRVVTTLLKGEPGEVKLSARREDYDEQSISKFGHEIRAFVKIQDGCDNFCSYCVIPQTRGNSRSRSVAAIIAEIRRLIATGYKEIVLTGIDMGSYREPVAGFGFSTLLERVLTEFTQGVRFRISSLEESQIDDSLLALFALYPDTLTPHLHIPLQSGSPSVLRAMHRKYDLGSFAELTAKFKRRFTELALSTDIIVGFPGETELDFSETLDFVRRIGFMRLHVFPFSPRPGTLAAALPDQVPSAVKNDRVRRLRRLGEEMANEYKSAFVGVPLDLLVEEKLSENRYRGYTQNYLDLEIESQIDLCGRIVRVALDSDLFPSIIS